MEAQAVRARAVVEGAAHGVGQSGDIAQPLRHRGDALVIELEAVEHRGGEAHLRAGGHVLGVGHLESGGVGLQGIGHREERGVLVGGGEPG